MHGWLHFFFHGRKTTQMNIDCFSCVCSALGNQVSEKKAKGNKTHFAKHLLCVPELVTGVLQPIAHWVWDQSPGLLCRICPWLAARILNKPLSCFSLKLLHLSNGLINICPHQRAMLYVAGVSLKTFLFLFLFFNILFEKKLFFLKWFYYYQLANI